MDLENLTDRPRQNNQESQNVFDARAIFQEAPSTGEDSAAKILSRANADANKFLPVLPLTDFKVPMDLRFGRHDLGDDLLGDRNYRTHEYRYGRDDLPGSRNYRTHEYRYGRDDLPGSRNYRTDDWRPYGNYRSDELPPGRNYYHESPKSMVGGYRDDLEYWSKLLAEIERRGPGRWDEPLFARHKPEKPRLGPIYGDMDCPYVPEELRQPIYGDMDCPYVPEELRQPIYGDMDCPYVPEELRLPPIYGGMDCRYVPESGGIKLERLQPRHRSETGIARVIPL